LNPYFIKSVLVTNFDVIITIGDANDSSFERVFTLDAGLVYNLSEGAIKPQTSEDVERNDSAEVKPVSGSLPCGEHNTTNNAIALLSKQLELPPDQRNWNVVFDVKNILKVVVAQQH